MNRIENMRGGVTGFCTEDNQDKAEFFASLTVDSVTAALAAGTDPNERDEGNATPLQSIFMQNSG